MDNPISESSALDTNQAASLFASMSEEPVKTEEQAETPEAAAERLAAEELNQSEPESETQESQPQKFTVKIDGKDVEVTLDEMRNGYQRQQDYTRKAMEVAEQRKAVEAEVHAARTERQQYAQNLQAFGQQLQAVLQDQSQINWQQLLDSDPQEYLKQRHLFEERHAKLQAIQQEQQRVWQQQQAEQAEYVKTYLSQQQQELLAKLPDWKNAEKANAEMSALKSYLANEGFTTDEINNIADHRHVVMSRKAMLYDRLMEKAQAATKKVEKLPTKVERPGVTETNKPDGRTAAMQRLAKTGRIEDAAAVFSQFL